MWQSIILHASIKKDENGLPSARNEVFRKIKDGGYFLSPFSTWSIQLLKGEYAESNVFQVFEKFKDDEIDLQLVGCGQYFRYVSAFSS